MHAKEILLGILVWVLASVDCDMCEYLQDCKFMESVVNDTVVTGDEIVDTPENVVIIPSNF